MKCLKRSVNALNLYIHLKTFKTLKLKLEEWQFKNQDVRVVLRGRIYQDFETSKNERQVGLGRKKEPGTHILRLKHTTSPGRRCRGCLTSEPLGQRMKRKILPRGFGEDTGPGLKSVEDQREGSRQVCKGWGLVSAGLWSFLAMGVTPSSLVYGSPIRSGLVCLMPSAVSDT